MAQNSSTTSPSYFRLWRPLLAKVCSWECIQRPC